jgi:hypothetical protein
MVHYYLNSEDQKHYQWQVIVDTVGRVLEVNNISHTCWVGETSCYVLKTTNFSKEKRIKKASEPFQFVD